MLKKLLATTVVLAMVAVANADITASWTETPTAGTLADGRAVDVYQIMVTVEPTDDWTTAGLVLDVVGSTFHQAEFSGNPPNPGLWPVPFPDLEFDTFYTSTADWPTAAYDGGIVGFAVSNDTDTQLATDWFDTADGGDGTDMVIAQFGVIADTSYTLQGELLYGAVATGGQLFSMIIPEPGTLALLALGGLALIRRR